MTKKKGEQDYEAAARIAKLKQIDNRGGDMVQASREFYDDLNKRLDSKGGFSEVKDIHKIGLAVKKTAMQQLIDFIKSDDFKYLYDSVKEEWFNTFLEKEKQQIKDAYDSGDYMASIKERLDYDESDYKYKNADEYFKHITSA